MKRRLTWGFLLLALVMSGRVMGEDERARPKIPMEQLLNGPDRQDIPWKVVIHEPRLMYQQRFIVQVKARISAELVSANNAKRKLHFILRVKTKDGGWLKGEQSNTFEVASDLNKHSEIEYATGVYFRPGDYSLALIAFDETDRISVTHRDVHVEALKDDPFPELDHLIPEVEFPKGFPDSEVGSDDESYGELFPVAHQAEWVNVENVEPIAIDIVLNVSKRAEPPRQEPARMSRMDARMRAMMTPQPKPLYPFDIGRLLQIGNVLAHLETKGGCMRVSAIDILRMKTIVDREPEQNLDWDKFQERIEKFDQNTVDAGVLANKKGPAQFVHKYLDSLAGDSKGCPGAARHYVIVITHDMPVPSGAKDEKLNAVDAERAKFYYLHGGASGLGDDVSEILKPTKPEKLGFGNPKEFRKSFRRIVEDLR